MRSQPTLGPLEGEPESKEVQGETLRQRDVSGERIGRTRSRRIRSSWLVQEKVRKLRNATYLPA